MSDGKFTTVEAYLAAKPAATRQILEAAMAIIAAALPGAEPVISYQIPAYRLNKRIVVFLAGWKQHWSMYPVPQGLPPLPEGCTSAKGTVRFPLSLPLPEAFIRDMVRLRLAETSKR